MATTNRKTSTSKRKHKPTERELRIQKIAKGRWLLPQRAPVGASDLHFTRATPTIVGGKTSWQIENWFDVVLPATDYSHAHESLGRAHAFEIIDALRNPDGWVDPGHFGCIFSALCRWSERTKHVCKESYLYGFGSVLGEYIQTHRADR